MTSRGRTDPASVALVADPAGRWEPALRYACFLASACGAELQLVPVRRESARGALDPGGAGEKLRVAALRYTTTPVRVVRPSRSGAGYASAIRAGPSGYAAAETPRPVEDVILEETRRGGVDVVVMPRGVRWSGGLYLALSVAERVALRAGVPVLVVPEEEEMPPLGTEPTILVLRPPAADPHPESLAWAASLADRLEGTVVGAGPTGTGDLPDLVSRRGADLVVLPWTPVRREGRGSVPAPMLSAALRTLSCPVLTVPGGQRGGGAEPRSSGGREPRRRHVTRTTGRIVP